MNPGEQVGPYKIVRRIGTGGMAEVFEAHRPGLEGFRSKVALKCMRHTEDERFIQLFINEARLGSQLHHLNIVGIQDFNRAGDLYYIAMELVDGVDLQTVLNRLKSQQRVMEPALVVHILLQALAGLGYAHRAVDDQGRPMGLIHRDVKPANIILSHEGVAKILDFGVAKALTSAFRTMEAVPRGTLAYMSPEQVAGERVLTPASDLFGVGAMLYEMLMAQSLYHEDNYARFLMAVAEADLREQLAAFKGRYPVISDVLARCLHRDATRRFQSAEELSGALQGLLPQLGPSSGIRNLLESVPDPRGGQPFRSTPNLAPASLPTYAGIPRSIPPVPVPAQEPSWKRGLVGAVVGLSLITVGLLAGRMFAPSPSDMAIVNPAGGKQAAPQVPVGLIAPTAVGEGGTRVAADVTGGSVTGGSVTGGSVTGGSDPVPPEAGGASATAPSAGDGSVHKEVPLGTKKSGSKPEPVGAPAGQKRPASRADTPAVKAESGAKKAGTDAPAEDGRLIVGAAPPDADVYENGIRLCEVPCDVRLPAGAHALELRRHDGHGTKKFTAEVEPGRTKKLVWDFDAQAWLAR